MWGRWVGLTLGFPPGHPSPFLCPQDMLLEVRSADRTGEATWDHGHGDPCWGGREKAEGRGPPEDSDPAKVLRRARRLGMGSPRARSQQVISF